MNYVRMRLARSIQSRVGTATRIASDTTRQEVTNHVDQLLTEQRTAHNAELEQLAENHRHQQAALVVRLDDIVRLADADRDSGQRLLRELAADLTATISATNKSVGSISASLTDAQRRQAYFVEQLARRVEVLERSLLDRAAADTTEPRS